MRGIGDGSGDRSECGNPVSFMAYPPSEMEDSEIDGEAVAEDGDRGGDDIEVQGEEVITMREYAKTIGEEIESPTEVIETTGKVVETIGVSVETVAGTIDTIGEGIEIIGKVVENVCDLVLETVWEAVEEEGDFIIGKVKFTGGHGGAINEETLSLVEKTESIRGECSGRAELLLGLTAENGSCQLDLFTLDMPMLLRLSFGLGGGIGLEINISGSCAIGIYA